MSMTAWTIERERANWLSRTRDFVDLTKPRISLMVLVTVAIAMYVGSSGELSLALAVNTLLGTALVAASASAWNQWLERDRDRRMPRTADRPLPAGRLNPSEVIAFGVATGLAGLGYLACTVGLAPAMWASATWLVYVCAYTPLKPYTTWNTAIGAVSGALPVVIGWSATGARFDARLAALFLVLFFWQFPHFTAIAWIYRKQYAGAGLRMMSVADPGGRLAGWYATGGALLLLTASMLPLLTDRSATYALAAGLLGMFQFFVAFHFQLRLSDGSARRLLTTSILYLPLALGLIAFQTLI